MLELQYLREIARLAATAHAVVEQAQDLDWTRDVFDRLIVAQAAFDGAALVTTDRAIRKHYPEAVW